jgi:hypothetical protein
MCESSPSTPRDEVPLRFRRESVGRATGERHHAAPSDATRCRADLTLCRIAVTASWHPSPSPRIMTLRSKGPWPIWTFGGSIREGWSPLHLPRTTKAADVSARVNLGGVRLAFGLPGRPPWLFTVVVAFRLKRSRVGVQVS